MERTRKDQGEFAIFQTCEEIVEMERPPGYLLELCDFADGNTLAGEGLHAPGEVTHRRYSITSPHLIYNRIVVMALRQPVLNVAESVL